MPVFDLVCPHRGLTHVLDKGLGPRGWEDVLEMGGDYISIVKLGWGTAHVTQNLERKLEVLKDKPVVIGGTLLRGRLREGHARRVQAWLQQLGISHVEISDGTVDIPRERKLELIADFARDFTVLSEVGSKDSAVEYTADEWTQWLREELEAGAWKVITEAREGGTAGIFDSSGGMRTELIGEIASAVGARQRHLRGAVEGGAGLVHQAVRAVGQPRQHPAGGSDPARDAPARAARRHVEGGAAWHLQLRADVEALTPEQVLALAARAVPGQGRARLLVPEGGDGPARHAVRARAEGARLRDRHALSLPGDLCVLARGRAALRHLDRRLRRPVAGGARGDPRRAALGAQARPLPRGREGRTARHGARRPRRVDHRHPPRPVADARGRAEARLGRAARAVEGESARRLDRRDVLGLHPRARAPVQPAARPRVTPRSATRIRRSRAKAARGAGPAPTRRSAASTPSRLRT